MMHKTQALDQHTFGAAIDEAQGVVSETLKAFAPRETKATWDVRRDERGRDMLVLTLSDPFGSASDIFAPEELAQQHHVADRVHRLIGNMLQSARRVSVRIADDVADQSKLEALRLELNSHPEIVAASPRLLNRVTLNMDGTFTVRDFSIEVSEAAASDVRAAVQRAGFRLKGERLCDSQAARDAVQRLVTAHLADPELRMHFAIWFRLDDMRDVHLLEICDGVVDPGDGSLEGVSLGASGSVPGRGRS